MHESVAERHAGAQASSNGVRADMPAEDVAAREATLYRFSWQLLGGTKLSRRPVASRSEVHAAIVRGLPYSSLLHFVASFKCLAEDDVVNVLGISTRTLRRQKETPAKVMPADLGSRTWLLAETFAKA